MKRLIEQIEQLERVTRHKLDLLKELKRSVMIRQIFPEIKESDTVYVSISGPEHRPKELKLSVVINSESIRRVPLTEVPKALRDFYLERLYEGPTDTNNLKCFFRRLDRAEELQEESYV